MINDPKERAYYELKRCCKNCKHCILINSKQTNTILVHHKYGCTRKRKTLFHDLAHDTGCKSFDAKLTPEQVKELALRFRQMMHVPSKKQRGREYQERCRQKSLNKRLIETKNGK